MIKKFLLIALVAITTNAKPWDYADISIAEMRHVHTDLSSKYFVIKVSFLTFYEILFINNNSIVSKSNSVHEFTHTLQQRRDGLKFWFSYGLQFLLNKRKLEKSEERDLLAYEAISYERQAYLAERIYKRLKN